MKTKIYLILFLIFIFGCKKNDNELNNDQESTKQIIFKDDFNQKGDWTFSFPDSLFVQNIFEGKIDSGCLTLIFSQNTLPPHGGIMAKNENILNQSFLDTLNRIGFIIKIKEGSFQNLYNDSTSYLRRLDITYNGLGISIPYLTNGTPFTANTIEAKYDNGETTIYVNGVETNDPNVLIGKISAPNPSIYFFVGYNDISNKSRIDILKIDYVEIYTW